MRSLLRGDRPSQGRLGVHPGRARRGEGGQRARAAEVAEAPWSVAEWAVALRFDNPRATVLVLLLG